MRKTKCSCIEDFVTNGSCEYCQGVSSSTETAGYVKKHLFDVCLVCKTKIPSEWPRLGGLNGAICMRCEGVQIDVWKVTLPGENSGYFDKDLSGIMALVEHMDAGTAYTISKETIRAAKYQLLPDFEGF